MKLKIAVSQVLIFQISHDFDMLLAVKEGDIEPPYRALGHS